MFTLLYLSTSFSFSEKMFKAIRIFLEDAAGRSFATTTLQSMRHFDKMKVGQIKIKFSKEQANYLKVYKKN